MRISILWLLLWLLSAGQLAIAAQSTNAAQSTKAAALDEQADPDPFLLPEIVVKAKRAAAPSSLLVREADASDFSAWNAVTVADALMWTPGVNVQVGGSSGDARAWVRSFRDRDVLILFDGIPIASPFEGTIDLNEIPIDSIERTRVMKGAPSVIYGTNGIGGVIDMLPKQLDYQRQVRASAQFGSNNREQISASAGGRFGASEVLIAGTSDDADDYALGDGFERHPDQPSSRRVNSDYKRRSLFLRVRAAELPVGDTALFFSHSNNSKGLTPEIGDPDYERVTRSDRNTLGISSALHNLPLSIKLFHNQTKSEITTYTDSGYSNVDEVEYGEDSAVGASVYGNIQTGSSGNLVLSASYVQDEYEAEGVFDNTNRVKVETYTLAAEQQWVIRSRLSVAVGGIFNRFEQPRLDKSLSVFNPQVAAGFELNPNWSLHASVAERTRLPKLRELYRRRYGNPNLNEQEALNLDLGLRYTNGSSMEADVTYFHSDINGLIERLDRRSLYENLQDVEIEGVEASVGFRLSQTAYLRLSGVLSDAQNTDRASGDDQLRSRPRKTYRADLRLQLPGATELAVDAIHVRDLYDRDPAETLLRLPGYTLVNATLRKPITPQLELHVAATNLLDKDYQHRLGFPREGRAFSAGVRYQFARD